MDSSLERPGKHNAVVCSHVEATGSLKVLFCKVENLRPGGAGDHKVSPASCGLFLTWLVLVLPTDARPAL